MFRRMNVSPQRMDISGRERERGRGRERNSINFPSDEAGDEGRANNGLSLAVERSAERMLNYRVVLWV